MQDSGIRTAVVSDARTHSGAASTGAALSLSPDGCGGGQGEACHHSKEDGLAGNHTYLQMRSSSEEGMQFLILLI